MTWNERAYMQKRRKARKRKRIIRILKRLQFMFNVVLVVIIAFLIRKNIKMENEADKARNNLSNIEGGDTSRTDTRIEKEKNDIRKKNISKFKDMYGDNEVYKNYTVCIDAGHGGNDVGGESVDGEYEKNQTLELAKIVKEYLESVGVRVVMTRTDDIDISLGSRKEIAENSKANLMLSLHRNIYEGNEDINGIEAWINNSEPYDAKTIAETILSNIQYSVAGIKNRGVKVGTMDNVNENYAVNKVSMTSMILELGFMSSRYDNQLFDDNMDEIAYAIAKGIVDNISC